MTPQRRWRLEACAHEARHAGYLHCSAIPVSRIVVRDDGSGGCEFAPLTSADLHLLFDHDMAQTAMNLVCDYIAAAVVGIGHREPLPPADRQAVTRYCALWAEVGGAPGDAILQAKGQLKALKWSMHAHQAIASFARQLDYCGALSGPALQTRLNKTFGPRPA